MSTDQVSKWKKLHQYTACGVLGRGAEGLSSAIYSFTEISFSTFVFCLELTSTYIKLLWVLDLGIKEFTLAGLIHLQLTQLKPCKIVVLLSSAQF